MKKTILALVASQFFLTGIVSANPDIPDGLTGLLHAKKLTIMAPDKIPACGVEVVNDLAQYALPFEYDVKRNDLNLIPFVNITKWGVGKGKYNPDVALLQNIGFQFGEAGRPVYEMGEAYVRRNFFILEPREGELYYDTEAEFGNTELEMTVTCIDKTTDAYDLAMKDFQGRNASWEFIDKTINVHNYGLSYDRNSETIIMPDGRSARSASVADTGAGSNGDTGSGAGKDGNPVDR